MFCLIYARTRTNVERKFTTNNKKKKKTIFQSLLPDLNGTSPPTKLNLKAARRQQATQKQLAARDSLIAGSESTEAVVTTNARSTVIKTATTSTTKASAPQLSGISNLTTTAALRSTATSTNSTVVKSTPSSTPTSTPTKAPRASLSSPSSSAAKQRTVTVPQFDESDFQQVLTNTIINQLDERVDWEQRANAMAQLSLICDDVPDDYVLATLSTARIALSLCSALSSPRSALVRAATKAVVALCRRCASSKRWLRDDAIGCRFVEFACFGILLVFSFL